jgi:hypothetical protein
LENDVNFRFLSGNQQPDFRTLSDFRKKFISLFENLFVHVLELCIEAGLTRVGRVALDGTKIEANAALKQNRTREGLEKEIQTILGNVAKTDREEDQEFGPEKRGDELPENLRDPSERLVRLRKAQKLLEVREEAQRKKQQEKIDTREAEEKKTGKKPRGRKPKPPEEAVDKEKKANVTDSDSRIQKKRNGAYIQGYNAQAAVDTESQIIAGQFVTQAENDLRQLKPMLEIIQAQSGKTPEEVLADAGYSTEENLALESVETEFFIPDQKGWKRRKELKDQGAPKARIPKHITQKDRMARKLRTKRGQEAYKHRGKSIEPVFGQIKERDIQGFNRFRLRGIQKVLGEWSLVCTGHNLRKLFRSNRMKQQPVA